MSKRINRYSGLPCRIPFDKESEDEPGSEKRSTYDTKWTKKRSRYSENLVRIPSEIESKYNGVSQKFDSDGEESDSPVEETAPRSASPESDGSGGGQDAGSSGNGTAPPSVSPVADGSGGGEEAGAFADDLGPGIIITRRNPPEEAYVCGKHGKQWHPYSCEECELVLERRRGSVKYI